MVYKMKRSENRSLWEHHREVEKENVEIEGRIKQAGFYPR
jgi:hypothetical protein